MRRFVIVRTTGTGTAEDPLRVRYWDGKGWHHTNARGYATEATALRTQLSIMRRGHDCVSIRALPDVAKRVAEAEEQFRAWGVK